MSKRCALHRAAPDLLAALLKIEMACRGHRPRTKAWDEALRAARAAVRETEKEMSDVERLQEQIQRERVDAQAGRAQLGEIIARLTAQVQEREAQVARLGEALACVPSYDDMVASMKAWDAYRDWYSGIRPAALTPAVQRAGERRRALEKAARALIIERDRLDAQALDCPMPEEKLWAALRAAVSEVE
jgi:chromosome segregation ATPase